ncbi:hypothetical protein GGP48_003200, partial [Salinibacter ruber]|nr:hypothetical protein [Salinibacter ruber]
MTKLERSFKLSGEVTRSDPYAHDKNTLGP